MTKNNRCEHYLLNEDFTASYDKIEASTQNLSNARMPAKKQNKKRNEKKGTGSESSPSPSSSGSDPSTNSDASDAEDKKSMM